MSERFPNDSLIILPQDDDHTCLGAIPLDHHEDFEGVYPWQVQSKGDDVWSKQPCGG